MTCELVSEEIYKDLGERVSLGGRNSHGKVLRQRQACSRKRQRVRVKVDGGESRRRDLQS